MGRLELIEFVKDNWFGGNCQWIKMVLCYGRFGRRYFIKWGSFFGGNCYVL